MQQVQYSAVPLDEPNPNNDYHYQNNSVTLDSIQSDGGAIKIGDPRYRADLDFDGSGAVDEFELFFASILENAKEGRKLPLTEDVWGVAIYSTVMDLPAILACDCERENVLRFMYVSLISSVNLLLQFGLLYWISIYVMLPSMRETQQVYFNFHRDVYDREGRFQEANFRTFDQADDLCQFPFFDRFFTAAVLFLWSSQCFIEIRSSERIFSGLISLPSLPWGISHNLMIHEGLHDTDSNTALSQVEITLTKLEARCSGNGNDTQELTQAVRRIFDLVGDKYCAENIERYLVCLTPFTRFSIFVLVLLPRMLIIFAVMLMGCVWLTATDRFDSLILNALALEFVVNVDNLLYTMFFPVSMHNQVENMKVAMPKAVSLFSPRRSQVGPEMRKKGMPSDVPGIGRSFIYLALVILFVFCFQAFQPVIPGFSQDLMSACEPFVDAWSSPRYGISRVNKIFACIMGQEDCFPYGKPAVPPGLDDD